jgi:NAD(P)-dependent dehydrogenase (short-subunit alcohol dehydrogenase family)
VASIEDLPADDFRAQLETNFFGVVNVTRAALPVLRAQGHGHIIQISSIGGRAASPGLGAYQSAKWAVGGFSEVLAQEVRPLGLRVTVVEPGGIRTDWAGASMKVHPVGPAYAGTVGAFATHVRANAEGSRGNPVKMAQAILAVAKLPDPPLRLLLGTDATFLAELVLKQRAAEDARFRELGESTDEDGMGRFADSPVAQMILKTRG